MEGSGKSAHLDALSHELRTAGFPVVVTREPGGTPLGEKIRNLIFEQNHETIDPRAELLLYLSARAQHVREVLRPSVDKGSIVLCDRFHDSTLAYQGAGRKLDIQMIQDLITLLFRETQPDLTILLDIDPGTAMERIRDRPGKNRFDAESILFHETVRQKYIELALKEPSRFRVIDNRKDFETARKAISREVRKFLENQK